MQHISRRNFIKTSGVVLGGASVGFQKLAEIAQFANVKHLGVQLWSVKSDMQKDAKGTIEALAKMGYTEVEGFGYDPETSQIFGMHHTEFATLLKTNGISMPSMHHNFMLKHYDRSKKDLTDTAKKVVNVAAQNGQKYLINPYMDANERLKIAELIPIYKALGEYCKKSGIQFGYHNHDFEFTISLDGRLLYEWLLEEVDSKLMKMEMDLYWVEFANNKPQDWFKKYPGRFELCHVKDLAKTEKRETIEVGDGSINFSEIFKKRQQAGFKYYIIELEHYKTTPLEGVKKGREYFTQKLKF